MQILNTSVHASQGAHLVLIFGLGMLGSSVRARLMDFQYFLSAEVEFDWDEKSGWDRALSLIKQHCVTTTTPLRRLSALWTAGKSGFGCSQEQARNENVPFLAVVDFLVNLKQALNPIDFNFHFVSSAGGLFEGQRVVNRNSTPTPMRPYGDLKLSQEKVLQETFATTEICIYRPSSVFGPMAQKRHQGLINNLVNDGLRGRETVLDAHVMSLRDYVYSGDIGHFIAKRIRSRDAENVINFLVSSKGSSIFEVVHTVERILHLKLRFRYDESFGNHSNITFSDSVLPPDWSPSTLNVGIRQFVVGKYANLSGPARLFVPYQVRV